MLSVQAEEALTTLATALVGQPELEEAVRDRWRIRLRGSAAQHDRVRSTCCPKRCAARRIYWPMSYRCKPIARATSAHSVSALPRPTVRYSCSGATHRLGAKTRSWQSCWRSRARCRASRSAWPPWPPIAWSKGLARRARLRAAAGHRRALRQPANAEARARLEILIWEAGASAREVPELGRWLWASTDTFEELVRNPARGALRGRVLAARCLEISVCGLSARADPELVGRTLQMLQPLLLHPEPLVWVHAARALGRLTGPSRAARRHAARLGARRIAALAPARDDRVRLAARGAAQVSGQPVRRHPRFTERSRLGARRGRRRHALSVLRTPRALGSTGCAHPRG